MSTLCFESIDQLAARLQRRELSAVELTRAYLGRIARLDDALKAYTEVYEDLALGLAALSDQRRALHCALGPLDGIPIAIKDLCELEGRVTSAGARAWAGRISQYTATAVQRLIAAGAVPLGKTQMVEFAFGGWGTNTWRGMPRNPWDTKIDRVPGGSSSGSGVAVAAGMAAAAIGSDTGGSICIPACLNGITGLKTSPGRISLHGVIPLSPSLDSLGPMTRSASDAALLTQLMAGFDAACPATHTAPPFIWQPIGADRTVDDAAHPLAGTSIAMLDVDALEYPLRPAVKEALHGSAQVLADLGANLTQRRAPFSFLELMELNRELACTQAYDFHQERAENLEFPLDPWVRQRILHGKTVSASKYQRLLQHHAQASRQWNAWLRDFHALLLPCCPLGAPPQDEADEAQTPLSLSVYTRATNFVRACALALPAGFDDDGLPVGVQLLGKTFDDAVLLRIGGAFQQATHWHQAHPEPDAATSENMRLKT